METIIIVAILALIIAIAFAWIEKKLKKNKRLYYKNKFVMTPAERKLYYTMQEALKDEKAIVLAQVNMNSFLEHRGRGARNQISQKSVDFLICNREAYPLVAIELQDKTHDKKDRKKSDEVKSEVLKTAHVPLVLFDARSMPTVATIKNTLEPFITSTRNN